LNSLALSLCQRPTRQYSTPATMRRLFRLWHGSFASVLVLRVALYSLMAVDTWRQLHRAPKFGVSGFNVSHLAGVGDSAVCRHAPGACEWLEAAVFPTPERMLGSWLVACYLMVLHAFGVANIVERVVLVAVMAYTTLVSQIDNYQHHYLMLLALATLGTIDWGDLTSLVTKTTKRELTVWQVSLLLLEV